MTELVGISTLIPFRRRGVASFLTAQAARAAFGLGIELVFLGQEPEADACGQEEQQVIRGDPRFRVQLLERLRLS